MPGDEGIMASFVPPSLLDLWAEIKSALPALPQVRRVQGMGQHPP